MPRHVPTFPSFGMPLISSSLKCNRWVWQNVLPFSSLAVRRARGRHKGPCAPSLQGVHGHSTQQSNQSQRHTGEISVWEQVSRCESLCKADGLLSDEQIFYLKMWPFRKIRTCYFKDFTSNWRIKSREINHLVHKISWLVHMFNCMKATLFTFSITPPNQFFLFFEV